jgi:enoyl-CoA hydratase/carnithine racemase
VFRSLEFSKASVSKLELSIAGGVATLALNRADKANALDADLVEALHSAFDDVVREQVRLLVIRGEGRNFCAGFDFSGFEDATAAELCWRFVRIELFLQKLFHAPFATMALAHAGCFGAGADIVTACGYAVAAVDAKFRMPGWKFGLALGTRRLAARVGAAAAGRVLQASTVLSAEEAAQISLVDEVCDAGLWEERIRAQTATASELGVVAQNRLLGMLRQDTRAEDMASLVGSLCDGDLKARISAFRNAR